MTFRIRLLVTIILWSVIGGLLIVNLCWGKGSILYTIPTDAVYSIGANSTKPKRLFDVIVARPSMDGQFLAVLPTPRVFRILNTGTGKTVKNIRLDTPVDLDFVWSPDGKWIAYIGYIGREVKEIYLISLQSGEIRQLTSHRKNKRRLVWSPDSQSIFYGETGKARGKYWEIKINNPGRPKEYDLFHKGAAFLGTPGAFFSFSHEGDHIAYGSAAKDGGVYIANANGTNHRRLTPNGSYRTYSVTWSPDDYFIAFFSYYHETRTSVLYTVSRHNPKTKRLIEIPDTAYGLTWVNNSALDIEPVQKLSTIWGHLKR